MLNTRILVLLGYLGLGVLTVFLFVGSHLLLLDAPAIEFILSIVWFVLIGFLTYRLIVFARKNR